MWKCLKNDNSIIKGTKTKTNLKTTNRNKLKAGKRLKQPVKQLDIRMVTST